MRLSNPAAQQVPTAQQARTRISGGALAQVRLVDLRAVAACGLRIKAGLRQSMEGGST